MFDISVGSISGIWSSLVFCLFFAGDTFGGDSLFIAWFVMQADDSARYDGSCLGVLAFTMSVIAVIG